MAGRGFRDRGAVRPPAAGPLLALLAPLALAALPARADLLPLQTYTVVDGLAGDEIQCAHEDRHGFLWLCTNEGLARFDGQEFRLFGEAEGLEPVVNDLLEGPDGTFWVGTARGVFRFPPGPGARFEPVPLPAEADTAPVVRVVRDPAGRIWALAGGLHRLEPGAARFVSVPLPLEPPFEAHDAGLAPDGRLWVATTRGLLLGRPGPDPGFVVAFPRGVGTAAPDGRGGLVLSVPDGAVALAAGGTATPFPRREPLRAWITTVVPRRDGRVWLGSRDGLHLADPVSGTARRYGSADGLRSEEVYPLLEDRQGNLWLTTINRGLTRLAGDGFVSFRRRDLPEPHVKSILTTRAGELVLLGSGHVFQVRRGDRFASFTLPLPPGVPGPGWGWNQVTVETPEGDWWIPSDGGLLRFPPVERLEDLARVRPEVFTEAHGLPGHEVFRVYQDRAGDLWVSTLDPGRPTLARRDARTGRFVAYGPSEGLPPSAPTAFAEDRAGQLWVGSYRGDLLRRREGTFRSVDAPAALAGALVHDLFLDSRGRLWIASRAGALRVDDPAAERPLFTALGPEQGLSSRTVRAVAEDLQGGIWLATNAGVDRLDPDSGAVRHYGPGDGVPVARILAIRRGRDGALWFGTNDGAAVYEPRTRVPAPAPRARIVALEVGGVPRPLPAAGETAIEGPALSGADRSLRIGFAAPGGEKGTRFQVRMNPGQPWSAPSADRGVLLAGLAPGRYRFQVRTAGPVADPGATVSFRVLPPLWRRGWVLLAAAALLALAALAAHRARVSRLLELERQRTRIAMDLHDEIGSGLGAIGLLADLAAATPEPAARARMLEEIAATGSELGTGLSDIVWSLRPGERTLPGLARRLAERGAALFRGGPAVLEVRLPAPVPAVPLTLAVQRAVLRIGLEALHNARKHAGASRVVLSLAPAGQGWVLSVVDDGRGLPAERAGEGFGLDSMRRRAAALGADLAIGPAPGGGTAVTLRFDPRATERGDGRPRGSPAPGSA